MIRCDWPGGGKSILCDCSRPRKQHGPKGTSEGSPKKKNINIKSINIKTHTEKTQRKRYSYYRN